MSRAYWSHADEEAENVCWEDEHDVDDGEDDVSDDAAYWCHSCGPDGEFGERGGSHGTRNRVCSLSD